MKKTAAPPAMTPSVQSTTPPATLLPPSAPAVQNPSEMTWATTTYSAATFP